MTPISRAVGQDIRNAEVLLLKVLLNKLHKKNLRASETVISQQPLRSCYNPHILVKCVADGGS